MNLKTIIQRTFQRKSVILFAVILVIMVGMVAMASVIAPHDPNAVDLTKRFLPWSAEYPFGTDDMGRCLFSRLLYGGQMTLIYALITTLLSAVIGVTIGMISGYYGGWIDNVIMRFCDIMYSFPSLIFTLIIVAVLGKGIVNVVIALLVTQWLYYARMSRSMTLAVRSQDDIDSAKVSGASTAQVVFKHILPNISLQLIALITIDFGHTILSISGLSFLGLGVQPPDAEWGAMINGGRDFIFQNLSMIMLPSIAIFLIVLCVNVVGDSLRDALDVTIDQEAGT